MRRLTVVLAVTCAAGGLLAAPAGGATAIDPADWADGFCTALVDWQSTAQEARDLVVGVIEDGVTSSTKAKATRKKIVGALKDASEGAELASDAIKDLGPPDVTNGAKISSAASSAISDTSEIFAQAAKDAAKFSTDPKQFRKQVKALKSQVDDGLEEAGQDISAIDGLDADGMLDAALSSEPACSSLS
jgi:hypothetical protein